MTELTVHIEGDVTRLHLGPGDVVVLRTEAMLTLSQAEDVQASLKHLFPDNEVLVLGDGISVEVVTHEGVVA